MVTGSGTNLGAGTVTLSGPAGTNLNNTPFNNTLNVYSLTIGEEGISIPGGLNGTITAGKYTVAGGGGKDVGTFNASITLATPLSLVAPLADEHSAESAPQSDLDRRQFHRPGYYFRLLGHEHRGPAPTP
ncbi:MAG: hypothetical protein WDO73_02395 [Ignavibacteriota bacterium]